MSFQDIDTIKTFLSIFEDISFEVLIGYGDRENIAMKIRGIEKIPVEELKRWIKTRNKIIHGNASYRKKEIITHYEEEKIKSFLSALDAMVEIIDVTLFTYYDRLENGTTCLPLLESIEEK